ncbi:MAG TPA: DUF5615 family PIN-like protein [Patescibacteria group bacterium]|nr:DUF5615 family PIN-like protein [Patescibacteria group bacterium]
MKYIVDAQLPKSLSEFISAQGFDCIHTFELPDKNATSDGFIARFAKEEMRVVITKDADFLESYIVRGEPSKLLLVKTGNVRNSELLAIFEKNIEHISMIFKTQSLIELTKEEIVVHA